MKKFETVVRYIHVHIYHEFASVLLSRYTWISPTTWIMILLAGYARLDCNTGAEVIQTFHFKCIADDAFIACYKTFH